MNMLFKRELSSMVPRLILFNGKLEIIRPLAYIQKKQIEDFIYSREQKQRPFSGKSAHPK